MTFGHRPTPINPQKDSLLLGLYDSGYTACASRDEVVQSYYLLENP